ncbi:hypothetical protein BH11CYA1_BH11CYA1_11820 [soil metagenome]
MPGELCKSCGKPAEGERAGSITSYFFQQNFCHCQARGQGQVLTPAASASGNEVCARCGKDKSNKSREGSFTGFLFQDLRCRCSAAGNPKRRSTVARIAQKKQFTQALRSLENSTNSPVSAVFTSGTIIGGTFKILSLIGEGGMSAVYLVEHLGLHRNFALKILAPKLVSEQGWLRFQTEAKTLAALNHQTFVKVFDLGIHQGTTPYYSMDYLRGYSLEELIAGDGPMPLESMLTAFLEIADGLAYAHRNGIIHRDLKPANIMISKADGSETVKVLDFGVSKLIGASSESMQQLTSAGDVFGTPFYMSPEQCLGEAVDARSDIYSLGCSMFEVLTGFVPYDGDNAVEIILMHQEADIPSALDLVPDLNLPPSIDIVLAKCLAKRPDERYQSVKELALGLGRIRDGKDVQDYRAAILSRHSERNSDNNQESGNGKLMLGAAAALTLLVTAAWTSLSLWTAPKPGKVVPAIVKVTTSSAASNLEIMSSAPTVWTGYDYAQEPHGSQNDQTSFSSIETKGNITYCVFNFPTDISLGLLSDTFVNGLVGIGQNAIGRVIYQENTALTYTPTTILRKYPQYLKRFKPGDIAIVNLDPTASGDLMLAAVAQYLPWIQYLVFKDTNELTANCIPSFNAFYDLRVVEASGSTISGSVLAKANCWSKLEKLHWASANNPGPLLKKLEKSPITELRFEYTRLTHEDFDLIAKFPNLKNLVLSGTKITAQDSKILARSKHLKRFLPQDGSL